MAEALIGMLKRSARIVGSYWPSLLAWFLFGVLGQYVFVRFAGRVGASYFGVGIALMPIAILCRLIAFVAMLLTVREALPNLISTSPAPIEPKEQRRVFVDALLAGILPFFAFYLAWGFLARDMGDFYSRVLAIQTGRAFEIATSSGADVVIPDEPGLRLTWVTITVLGITFGLRWIAKRYSSRSARVGSLIAVYLEALWVMLAGLLLTLLKDSLMAWFDERQGLVWLAQLRTSIAVHSAPLDWALAVTGWLIGELGGVILLPLAWLTIAGAIYGETLDPASPAARFLSRGRIATLRERARRVPGWLRRRLNDVWDDLVARVRPIGNAFKLMWHAGVLLISIYVLLYRGVEWLSGKLDVAVAVALGPHPRDFWVAYAPVLALIAPTLTTPLLIGVVGGAFDQVLGRLRSNAPTDVEDAPSTGYSDVSTNWPPPTITTPSPHRDG